MRAWPFLLVERPNSTALRGGGAHTFTGRTPYTDRLDGVLTAEEFQQKAVEWRKRQAEIQLEVQGHQRADVSYLQEASWILDLSQRAYELYTKQQDYFEKRKLIELVVSKLVISDHRVVSNLREPFKTLSKVAVAASSSTGRPRWLGR